MAASNPFRFSTKYQDAETGLLYYGHRYQNATTGRWLSKDPADEDGGLNLYAFNYNSPINWFDPDGRAPMSGGFPTPFPPFIPPGGFPPAQPTDILDLLNTLSDAADALSIALIACDIAAAGPTGEGILPAMGIQALKKCCCSPQQLKRAIERIKNIKGSLKPGPKGDISGVGKEMTGGSIPKPGQPGKVYDHVKEWNEKMRGLRKAVETLKKCGDDPAAKQALQEAERMIQELETAFNGLGI
jgi:RHS repeat-associated protein